MSSNLNFNHSFYSDNPLWTESNLKFYEEQELSMNLNPLDDPVTSSTAAATSNGPANVTGHHQSQVPPPPPSHPPIATNVSSFNAHLPSQQTESRILGEPTPLRQPAAYCSNISNSVMPSGHKSRLRQRIPADQVSFGDSAICT